MEDLLDPVELTEDELQEVAGGCGSCNPQPNPCGGHGHGINLAAAVAVAGAVAISL